MADSAVLGLGDDSSQHDHGAPSQAQEQGTLQESFQLGHGRGGPVVSQSGAAASGSVGVHVWGQGHALRERCPCGCEGDPEDTSGLSWRDDGTAQTLNSGDASLSNSPWDEEARRKRRFHVDPLAGWRTAFSDPAVIPSRAFGLSVTSDLSGPFHAPTWPGLAPKGGGIDLSSGHRPDYGSNPIVGLSDPAKLYRGPRFGTDMVSNMRQPAVPPPDVGSVKMVRPSPSLPSGARLPPLPGAEAISDNNTTSNSPPPDLMAPMVCAGHKGSEGSAQGSDCSPNTALAEDASINPENWPSLADLWEKGLLHNIIAQGKQLSRLCAPGPAAYSCLESPSLLGSMESPCRAKESADLTPSSPISPTKSLAVDHPRVQFPVGMRPQPSELSHWVQNHWLPPLSTEGSKQSGDSVSLGWATDLPEAPANCGQGDTGVAQGVPAKEVMVMQAPTDAPQEPVTFALLNNSDHAPPETAQLLPLPSHSLPPCATSTHSAPPSFPNGSPPPIATRGAAPFEFSPAPAFNNPTQPCLQLRLGRGPQQPQQATVFHPAPTGASGLEPSRASPPGDEVNGKLAPSLSGAIHCHSPPLSPSPPPPPEGPESHRGQTEASAELQQQLNLGMLDSTSLGQNMKESASSRRSSPAAVHPNEQVSSQGSPDVSLRSTVPTTFPSHAGLAATTATAKTSSVGVQTDAITDEALLKDMAMMKQALEGAQTIECGRLVWNAARQQTGPQGPLSMTPIKVSTLPRRYSPSPPASPIDAQLSPLSSPPKNGTLPPTNASIGNNRSASSGGPPGPAQSKANTFDPFLGLQYNVRPNSHLFTSVLPPFPGSPAIPCARHGFLCRTAHQPYARSRSSLIPAGAPDPPPPSALGLSPLSASKSMGQSSDRLPPAPRKATTFTCSKCTSWSAPPACAGHSACSMGARCSCVSTRSWSNPAKPPQAFAHSHCPQGRTLPHSPTGGDMMAANHRRLMSGGDMSSRLLSGVYPYQLQVGCGGGHAHLSMQGLSAAHIADGGGASSEATSRHLLAPTHGQLPIGDVSHRLAAARQRQDELGMGGVQQAFGPPLPSLGGTASALAPVGLHSLEPSCQDWMGNVTSFGVLQRESTSPGSQGSHQQNGVQSEPRQQQVAGSNSPTKMGQQPFDRSPNSRPLEQWGLPGCASMPPLPNSGVPSSSSPLDPMKASLSRPVAIRPSPHTPTATHLNIVQGAMGFAGRPQMLEAEMGWNLAEWAGQLPALFNGSAGRLGGPSPQTASPVLSYGKKAEGDENSVLSPTRAAAAKDRLEEAAKLGATGLANPRAEVPSSPSFDVYRQHGQTDVQEVRERGLPLSPSEPRRMNATREEKNYSTEVPAGVQIDVLGKSSDTGLSGAQIQSIYGQQNLPTSGGGHQAAGALSPNRGNKRAAASRDATSSGAPMWLEQLAKRQREQ